MATPVEVGPFPEGINLIDPIGQLSDKELSLSKNWRLDPLGDLVKRPGFGGYGSAPAKINGDFPVKLVARYYKSGGNKETLAIANQTFKKGDDGTGAWTNIALGGWSADATRLHDYFIYKDYFYLLGGSFPVRYNGTDLLAAGHYQHVAAGWSAAQVAGAIPDGTYKYMMTSIEGDRGEGGYTAGTGEKTVVVSGGPRQVNFTVLDSAPAAYGATGKQLWRTKIGGSIYYKLAILAAGATTYSDNATDGDLIDAYEDVAAPPASAKYAIVGDDDRVYYWGMGSGNESIVQVSDVGFPDRIVDNLFIGVAPGDGDEVVGAAKVPSGIVFLKQNSMWLHKGIGFGLELLSDKIGCRARFSIVSVPGGFVFLSQEGEVYFYDGVNFDLIGRKVKPQFINQNESSSALIAAVYHDYRYIISYDYRVNKGYNWRELEYDFVGRKWDGPHENLERLTASYFSVWDSQGDSNQLLWGEANGSNGSYIYKREEGTYTDNGVKSEAIARSGCKYFGSIGEKKFFKVFGRGMVSSDCRIEVRILEDDGSAFTSAFLFSQIVSANTLIWGIGNWGAKVWGGSSLSVSEDTFDISARGRKPVIEITDGGTATEAKLEALTLLTQPLEVVK